MARPSKWLDWLVFQLVYMILYPIVRAWYPIRVEGRRRFGAGRPVVLAPNHVSFLDPILLQAALPRRITYLMTDLYYGIPGLNWVFRRIGCIPIKQEGSQLNAIRRGIEALERYRLVAIFPEGTRSFDGKLQQGFAGAATMAQRARAIVVPVAIVGTFESLPRGSFWPRRSCVTVRFGEPIDFEAIGTKRPREMTEIIMQRIGELLPPSYAS